MSLKNYFVEYHSINNGASGLRVRSLKTPPPSDTEYIALEKIHGSNFCFLCNGNEVVCGKRTSALEPHETFYSFQKVRDKYSKNVESLFNNISKQSLSEMGIKSPEVSDSTHKIHHITIFGELFGGVYPHPDVQDLFEQPIQKGVYYIPHLDFMAFDLVLALEPKEGGEIERKFINYDIAIRELQKVSLPILLPLIRGTKDECLKYNINRNSTIPKLFGLPPLELNLIEGIVVKSVEPIVGKEKNDRSIAKVKNAKFQETNPKCETLYEKKVKRKKELINFYIDDLERYITLNRKDNLESKIGHITKENIIDATQMFVEDVIKDFNKDIENSDDYQDIENDENIRECVFHSLPSRIRTFLMNNIN